MAKPKKIRDRIITIDRIYEEPREKEVEGLHGTFTIYNWGMKLEDGTYANIAFTGDDAQEKYEKRCIVDTETGEEIKEGGTYKVYEESSDAENKYWNVTAFVKVDKTDPILSKKTDRELAKEEEEIGGMQCERDNSGKVLNPPNATIPRKIVSPKPASMETTGGGVSSYKDMEERKQKMIVRQSALNYATQIESIFITWKLHELQEGADISQMYEFTKDRIKSTAKEYEEQIMRK